MPGSTEEVVQTGLPEIGMVPLFKQDLREAIAWYKRHDKRALFKLATARSMWSESRFHVGSFG